MPEPRVSEPLYDAVAAGMWLYTSLAFRAQTIGLDGWRVSEGELLVATHRAESDVPLLCARLWLAGSVWRHRGRRLHFAAREDMFDRGFFAGFPPGLPPRARRLLYPLRVGRYLPLVRVHPLPYPGTAVLRLGRALEAVDPATPLEEVVPPAVLARLWARAAEAERPSPRRAADVLRGEYADLLWQFLGRDELSAPAFEPVWRERGEQAGQHLRRLVELVRRGESILFFPEGRPSPDGSIGPVRRGLGMLVRRGGPRALRPIAIAYDPLARGRPRAYVAVGKAAAPPPDGVEEAVLAALRRTMPLTSGQLVAHELLAASRAGESELAAGALEAALAGAVEASRTEGRPVEPMLLEAAARRSRLAETLAGLEARGLVRPPGAAAVRLDPARLAADPVLGRLAREYASAREAV